MIYSRASQALMIQDSDLMLEEALVGLEDLGQDTLVLVVISIQMVDLEEVAMAAEAASSLDYFLNQVFQLSLS